MFYEVLGFRNKVVNFTKMFPYLLVVSTVFFLIAIIGLCTKGLNLGVDFKGGAEIQVKFNEPVSSEDLRKSFSDASIALSSVQAIGENEGIEFLLKVGKTEDDLNKTSNSVVMHLNEKFSSKGVDIRRTEIVGPKAGVQLRNDAIAALLLAMVGIMIYVGMRFDYRYAPGAVISLIHDAVFVIGIFVFTGKEFNLQIVGAILALIGYSVNDTVVIYDRIREHENLYPQKKISELVNKGLTETLGRSIITSFTTFTVCLTMFFMGGGIIHDFFFALWTGILVGTYSSLFIATPLVLFFSRYGEKSESLRTKIS
jgi:preprotein translocase subunit SecF